MKSRIRSIVLRFVTVTVSLLAVTAGLLDLMINKGPVDFFPLWALLVMALPVAAIAALLSWPLSFDDRLEPGALVPLRCTYLFYTLFVTLIVALLLSSMFWLGDFAQVKTEHNLTQEMLSNDCNTLKSLAPRVQKPVTSTRELSRLLDHAFRLTNSIKIPGGFAIATTASGIRSVWGELPGDTDTLWEQVKKNVVIRVPAKGGGMWTRSYMMTPVSISIGGQPVHVLFGISIANDLSVTGMFLGRVVWLMVLLGALLTAIVMLSFGRIAARPATAALERSGQFTGDAGHELRTPLAAIQLNAEMALRPQSTPEQVHGYTEATLRQARSASGAVESLLLLARLSHSAARPGTPVPFGMLCADVQRSLASLLEGKNLRLEVAGDDVMVSANRGLMLMVLKNLVQNAAQWSPAGAVIKMSASAVSRRRIRISITDHGEGITAEALPHIFERFYRADPGHSHAQHGGAGLGLAIVKQAASCMRGSVTAVSTLTSGTTVTLLLPR